MLPEMQPEHVCTNILYAQPEVSHDEESTCTQLANAGISNGNGGPQ